MTFEDETGSQPVGAVEDAAANALRSALRVAIPVEDAEAVARRREHLLTVLGQEIERVPRELARRETRARLRTSLRWMAAAAAAVALIWGGASFVKTLGESGTGATAARGQAHSHYEGKLFETAESTTQELSLAGDTSVRLSAETRLRIFEDTAAEQSFQLSRGSIRVLVPKTAAPRSVRVLTPHATVSVKGTLFYVDVAPDKPGDGAARTRVRVEHGRVVVQHPEGEATLDPGQTWISPASDPVAAAVDRPARASQAAVDPLSQKGEGADSNRGLNRTAGAHTKSSATATSTPRALTSPGLAEDRTLRTDNNNPSDSNNPSDNKSAPSAQHDPSTLAHQNALLEAALLAEKRGANERAHELIDRLLLEYPRSPLRASAQALKKRLK